MKTVIASGLFLLTLFIGGSAQAETRTVQYPIQHVLNASIDPNTQLVQFTVGVTYPNGCFTPATTSAMINYQQRSISLNHIARQVDGDCTQAIVNQYPTADLNKPESGTYKVWDASSTRYLGALVVTDQGVEFERSQSDPELIIREGGNYL